MEYILTPSSFSAPVLIFTVPKLHFLHDRICILDFILVMAIKLDFIVLLVHFVAGNCIKTSVERRQSKNNINCPFFTLI